MNYLKGQEYKKVREESKKKIKKQLEDIRKENKEERFPVKKYFDLKKELNEARKELDCIAEFQFSIEHLIDHEKEKESLLRLKGILSRMATAKVILDKIEGKI